MTAFESFDCRCEIAVGPLRQADQLEQRVRHAAAGRQHDGFARVRRRLDDARHAAETIGVSDARAAKFLYYPFTHVGFKVGRRELEPGLPDFGNPVCCVRNGRTGTRPPAPARSPAMG